jgi:hypothetical protein
MTRRFPDMRRTRNHRSTGDAIAAGIGFIFALLVLLGSAAVAGDHKIVYDQLKAYLCSDPVELASVNAQDLAEKVQFHVGGGAPIGEVLEQVFNGFADRAAVRRPREVSSREDSERDIYAIPSDDGRQSQLRQERLARFRAAGRSREESVALAVGAEAWSLGAQLVFVTE